MLLLRAEGCIVCLGLEIVEGVFESVVREDGRAVLPGGRSVPLTDWPSVSGVGVHAEDVANRPVVAVRTERGTIGLEVDSCLGVRDVSFLESPPVPTQLTDASGAPLCYLLVVDERPIFLIEPRALAGVQTAGDRAEPAAEPPAQVE